MMTSQKSSSKPLNEVIGMAWFNKCLPRFTDMSKITEKVPFELFGFTPTMPTEHAPLIDDVVSPAT